jgi:hypothetical protein
MTVKKPLVEWQYFPKHSPCTDFLISVVAAFEEESTAVSSRENVGQSSDVVLAKLRPRLQGLGFRVESGKTADSRIRIPVLYGKNGSIEKSFDADAFHPREGVVLEIEAGRGVTNYQFLKDLFQACVMQGVDYLVIAVRQDYRGSNDFEKVCTFFETIFSSNRLILPLRGMLILGY